MYCKRFLNDLWFSDLNGFFYIPSSEMILSYCQGKKITWHAFPLLDSGKENKCQEKGLVSNFPCLKIGWTRRPVVFANLLYSFIYSSYTVSYTLLYSLPQYNSILKNMYTYQNHRDENYEKWLGNSIMNRTFIEPLKRKDFIWNEMK